jgi:hypothetical protein
MSGRDGHARFARDVLMGRQVPTWPCQGIEDVGPEDRPGLTGDEGQRSASPPEFLRPPRLVLERAPAVPRMRTVVRTIAAVGSNMLRKTLGVTMIVVLGGVWFVLQESAGSVAVSTAAAERIVTAPAQTPEGLPALRREGSSPEDIGPAHVPPRQRPAGNAPATQLPRKQPAGAPAAAGSDDAFMGAMSAAARLVAQGDQAGAEAALRQAMARAQTAAELGQAALQLAVLTTNRLERRQLLSIALRENAVLGADFEAVGQHLRQLNASAKASLVPLLTVEHYTVAPRDNLWTLVNKVFPDRYGVSPEVGLVKLVNGMSSDQLKVGQVLLVPIGELRLRVDIRQHGLIAWMGDVAIAAYRVGLGKDERTPIGSFTVRVKQENPAWFHDGRVIPFGSEENVLGTRWMGFDDQPGATGFGIHGTSAPETIGSSESMGCVRMRNHEVEELFEYVARGSRVVIS